jgi:hypothetical protein
MHPSFAAGELAETFTGRVDMAKYLVGAKSLKNWIVQKHGGIANRPGTEFVCDSYRAARLLPFEFNTVQTYILEFTFYLLRVIKDEALVVQNLVDSQTVYKWTVSAASANVYYLTLIDGTAPNLPTDRGFVQDYYWAVSVWFNNVLAVLQRSTVPTALQPGEFTLGDYDSLGFTTMYVRIGTSGDPDAEIDGYVKRIFAIDSPYEYDDIQEVAYTQSADVMFMVHPDFPPKTLTRTDHDQWTFTNMAFVSAVNAPALVDPDYSATPGGTTREVIYNVGAVDSEGEESIPSLDVSVTVDSPWPSSALVNINWNPLVIAGTNPYKWTQSPAATNEYYLELLAGGDPDFDEPLFLYENVTGAVGVRIVEPMVAGTVGSLAVGEWDYGDNDTLGYDTIYVRVTGSVDPDTLADYYLQYQDVPEYNVYKNARGYFGFIGVTTTPWFSDDNIVESTSLGPKEDRNPFDSAGNYPGAVGIFEQRLLLARTDNQPQTIWASQTGHLYNFGVSKPLSDEDSIEATIASRQVNEVLHMMPLESLLVFTKGGEWVIEGEAGFRAITPTAFFPKPQGYRGAYPVPPIAIGASTLFVQKGGKVIRDGTYSQETARYSGQDLTLLATHLFEDTTIKSWDYQQNPQSLVWVVLDDGTLLSMTYVHEQEIWAWTHHETVGSFIDVAVLTTEDESEDAVYVQVQRTDASGNALYYVEKLSERDLSDLFLMKFSDSSLTLDQRSTHTVSVSGATQANPVVITTTPHTMSTGDYLWIESMNGMVELNQRWFKVIDTGGSTYSLTDINDNPIDGTGYTAYAPPSGSAITGFTTISGLDHLDDQAVSVLADGNFVSGKTVSGAGVLTLDSPARTAVIGLPYQSHAETLNITAPEDSLQGRKKKIGTVIARLYKTRGGKYGGVSDTEHLNEMPPQSDEYNEAGELFTGDFRCPLDAGWDSNGKLHIIQDDPLPITVIALIPEVQIGG